MSSKLRIRGFLLVNTNFSSICNKSSLVLSSILCRIRSSTLHYKQDFIKYGLTQRNATMSRPLKVWSKYASTVVPLVGLVLMALCLLAGKRSRLMEEYAVVTVGESHQDWSLCGVSLTFCYSQVQYLRHISEHPASIDSDGFFEWRDPQSAGPQTRKHLEQSHELCRSGAWDTGLLQHARYGLL